MCSCMENLSVVHVIPVNSIFCYLLHVPFIIMIVQCRRYSTVFVLKIHKSLDQREEISTFTMKVCRKTEFIYFLQISWRLVNLQCNGGFFQKFLWIIQLMTCVLCHILLSFLIRFLSLLDLKEKPPFEYVDVSIKRAVHFFHIFYKVWRALQAMISHLNRINHLH